MRVVECGAGNLEEARTLAALRAECEDLAGVYGPPGTLLLAYAGGVPAGCAGLVDRGEHTAEVKRLYVRPAFRGEGIARALRPCRWCSCGGLFAPMTFGYPEPMRYLVPAGWWRPV